MFRERDPQGSLFQSAFLFPEAKFRRLEKSWADMFQSRALPLIDESCFADMYCEDNGRPNRGSADGPWSAVAQGHVQPY